MKKVLFCFLFLIVMMSSILFAKELTDERKISNLNQLSIYLPQCNTIVPPFEQTIRINMENDVDVSGIDLELRYPPEQLSIIDVTGTRRVRGKPTAYIDDPTEGIFRFFWAEGISIDPGAGPIFEMTVSVPVDDICGGPHEISITDVVVATTEGITRDVLTENGEFFFRRRGDFNRDCKMDVLDALYVPIFIFCLSCGHFLTGEDYMLLDFNNDGASDVLDMLHMIDFILHQP